MKITHICLSNFFVDGVAYQENQLVRQHLLDGHDVLVIASTETHSPEGKLTYVSPSDYVGVEGARIVRLPYKKILPQILMRKLRMHDGLKELLDEFSPDIIMFHGTCGWELITVTKILDANPDVLFYIDSHEDRHNSARNWLSREILHKQYYRRILSHSVPYCRKILCYSPESIDFVKSIYGIPEDCLELYPLGGRIIGDLEYFKRRKQTRDRYGISDEDILIVQSGKQIYRKKLIDSLNAVHSCKSGKIKFLIAGLIDNAIVCEVNLIIDRDTRIRFIGWQSYEDLSDLLCATDVYLQPADQSVSMQHSLCCRCAVIIEDLPSHHMYVDKNGWIIGLDGSLQNIINSLETACLEEMKCHSLNFAKEHLDYRKLAKRVLKQK